MIERLALAQRREGAAARLDRGEGGGPAVDQERAVAGQVRGRLGERLSDRLDTRVKVAMGKSKGRVTIEFASLGDLERIVSIIDPRNRTDRPI